MHLFTGSRLIGAAAAAPVLATLWSLAPTSPDQESCRRLLTPQQEAIGRVCVTSRGDSLVVSYRAGEGWTFLETHLAVAADRSGLPLTESGIPRLGEFALGDSLGGAASAVYAVAYADLRGSAGDSAWIAAHASMLSSGGSEQGVWAEGTRFVEQGMPATYFVVALPDAAGSASAAATSASRSAPSADAPGAAGGPPAVSGRRSTPPGPSGGPARDTLIGGDGPDVLFGGGDTDLVDGGAGPDWLDGGDGDDLVRGGDGDDVIEGGPGTNVLEGGPGDDRLVGGDGKDWIFGEDGDDHADGGAGDDVIEGGEGADQLLGLDGDDILDGGPGVDFLSGGDGNDIVDGGDDADRLDGGSGDDDMDGGDGPDFLDGFDGDDVLAGGDGDDVLDGGAGTDALDGGDGNDVLAGGDGDDALNGGDGDDILRGGPGGDLLGGGEGADVLLGEVGADTLLGHAGDDQLDGGQGDDVLRDGVGDDILLGGLGRDVLFPGVGVDLVRGGAGDDVIVLRAGDAVSGERELADGGEGANVLVLHGIGAAQTIPRAVPTRAPGDTTPPPPPLYDVRLDDPWTGGRWEVDRVSLVEHREILLWEAGSDGTEVLVLGTSEAVPAEIRVVRSGQGTDTTGALPPVLETVPPLGARVLRVPAGAGAAVLATSGPVAVRAPLSMPGIGTAMTVGSPHVDAFAVPLLLEQPGARMGLVITQGELAAPVRAIIHDSRGVELESRELEIGAGQRLATTVEEIFGPLGAFEGSLVIEGEALGGAAVHLLEGGAPQWLPVMPLSPRPRASSHHFPGLLPAAGASAVLVIGNPVAQMQGQPNTARGAVVFLDASGRPVPVQVGDTIRTGVPFEVAGTGMTALELVLPAGSSPASARVEVLEGEAQAIAIGSGSGGRDAARLHERFVAAVQTSAPDGTEAFVALQSGGEETQIELVLRDRDGRQVPSGTATLEIAPGGSWMGALRTLFPAADTGSFLGNLTGRSVGAPVAVSVTQSGPAPGPLPVAPLVSGGGG